MNPNHDELGRFASGATGSTASIGSIKFTVKGASSPIGLERTFVVTREEPGEDFFDTVQTQSELRQIAAQAKKMSGGGARPGQITATKAAVKAGKAELREHSILGHEVIVDGGKIQLQGKLTFLAVH